MIGAAQLPSDYSLVLGLVHARVGRRPYRLVSTLVDAKLLATLAAGAAWAGFSLLSVEGDDGMELLVATRGAETIRFENRQQVGAWLNHIYSQGRPRNTGEAYAGPA